MKNRVIFFVTLTFMVTGYTLQVKAQDQKSQPENYTYIKAGYGFGDLYFAIFHDFTKYEDEDDYNSKVPGSYQFKLEAGLNEKFSVGINSSYSLNTITYTRYEFNQATQSYHTFHYKAEQRNINVLTRLNWHFITVKKFDPYFGFGIGYRDSKWTFTDDNPEVNDKRTMAFFPLATEVTVGANFYFTKNVGFYAETGFSFSVAQFGLVVRL